MTRFVVPLLTSAFLLGCASSHGGSDAGAEPRACAASSECVVVSASCCGSCGAATRGDAVAIHVDSLGAHRTSACPDGTGCPACYREPDPTLLAACRAGRCELVDVLAEPPSACGAGAACRVRTRDCCECGGDVSRAGLIAIRADGEAAYMDLVCEDGAGTPCPECAPSYPSEAAADCDPASGRCRIVWAEP